MTINWYENQFACDYAVKGADSVLGYDAQYNEVFRIINISGEDWPHISLIGGEWSEQSDIPTQEEKLRADVDFCLAMLGE